MKRRILGALSALVFLCIGGRAWAQEGAPVLSEEAPIPGWTEVMQSWNDMPARALAMLPEEQRNDPQVRQEVGRLLLAAIASSAIDALGSDGDHPVFLPSLGQVLSVGQPNADTSYRSARITPGGSYRIRGVRGSLRMFMLSQSGPPVRPAGGGRPNLGPQRVDHDFNALSVDAEGRYDVILSPARPAGYAGDWWELQPASEKLLLRMVNADLGEAVEPTISIERLDVPAARPRPSAAALERQLRGLIDSTPFSVMLLLDRVERLRQQGYVNRLRAVDFSRQGGLARQHYYEGAYELRDDEALILEVRSPANCLYRSVILTNSIYETTDWYNNISSLNDSQATPDSDGVLRIIVSARDPGTANWLSTAGYPLGAIQGRWVDCDAPPVPNLRKVAFRDIARLLPRETRRVTPEERERTLRERRAALQQRPLW